MKIQYERRNFTDGVINLIGIVNGILDEYVEGGYDLSLRQLYYQLVSRGYIENTERSYKNVGNMVSHARLAGLIDWDVIKDRGREVVVNSHWSSPADILETCASSYRIDMWANQREYVEVMIEKEALEGVLLPVCRRLDVPFTANKGYSSSSAMYEAGERIKRRLLSGKTVTILYMGDHDPSGIDMTRDVYDRLCMFSMSGILSVDRLALNMDQVDQYNPPPNPTKVTDSRSSSYLSKYGKDSWELDALEPKVLSQLVQSTIITHIDPSQWEKDMAIQQDGVDYLREMAVNYRPPAKRRAKKS